MSDSLILFLLLLVLLLIVFILFRQFGDAPRKSELMRLQGAEAERDRALARLEAAGGELERLRVEQARLEADLQHERRSAAEKISLLEESEVRLQKEFENLAGRILEERGRALGEENRERMATLLQPFREQLDGFRRRVDELHEASIAGSAGLREQVRQLMELSGRLSDEANTLARAIKGEAKKQGDWGEMIVERIFEASGLEKDREYVAQGSFRNEDGMLRRPDFMVMLPGGKAVIVDSKVSLTAYERFCSEEDESRRERHLKEHVQSVRRHISGLLEKDYHDIGGNRTLDFVIMCIPLEPAWQAVMQADPELLYDLSGKNVVLCGPATLMITLKLIAQIWRRENENRNAELIADKAGRIYDQVALIVDAMDEARKRLSGVSDSFDLALRRLSEGRGNLVGKVEEIRRLGAKVSRRIATDAAEDAQEGSEG
ncbi:MAG: DNA recombination protein RmuC [Chlorobi bacterium]|nr:DNA recombination protein RmuC [Chlorobiota bacterium]